MKRFTTVFKVVWLGGMIAALAWVLRSTLPEPIEQNWIEEPSDELMDFK